MIIGLNKPLTIEKAKNTYIAIDWDGTIVKETEGEFITNADKFVLTHDSVFEILQDMRNFGISLILWTCREGTTLIPVLDFCKRYNWEWDSINKNIHPMVEGFKHIPNKIVADYYIDNRSCPPFPGWTYIQKTLMKNYYENKANLTL
jgi:hypothetical protein